MGLFDWVKYEAPCINCGYILTGWQTKTYKNCLETIEPWQARNMHCPCPNYKTWNECKIEAETEVVVKSIKITPVKDHEDL